ncbi:hypothetical protein P691DRAFT_784047 [Macrolepiota fuliginosa MF-IS2]|uniref:Uncharacterized protein n=1 Tax=Macrolepiota fuliginosa MF-IS2 TaxID=1400762 RepID=A0A9P5WYB7_9AGAR|nr:hypothetical protein P691DRAFT_784047 [Macrolepiota fuliginosa MF-IS2]
MRPPHFLLPLLLQPPHLLLQLLLLLPILVADLRMLALQPETSTLQPPLSCMAPHMHLQQFYIEAPNIPSDTSLPSLVNMANCALTCARSTLKVNTAYISPCGITCVMASVPSTSDLNIIKATLSGGLLGACVSILASRSFIKIIDVPFFQAGTATPFSNAEVDAQLQHSIIPSNFIVHWHYSLLFNRGQVTIKGAKAHTGTPQCQQCWKWGHTTDVPCSHVHACINCGNPHAANNQCCPYRHHQFNWTWIKDWSIQDTLACKGIPPPPTTPHGPKPRPHDPTVHPIQRDTTAPPLPPIEEEDDKGDDDEMEFSHELDNYDFRE